MSPLPLLSPPSSLCHPGPLHWPPGSTREACRLPGWLCNYPIIIIYNEPRRPLGTRRVKTSRVLIGAVPARGRPEINGASPCTWVCSPTEILRPRESLCLSPDLGNFSGAERRGGGGSVNWCSCPLGVGGLYPVGVGGP